MNGVPDAQTRSRALEQRRCIILAAIGSTAEVSPNNPTLKNILNAGLLAKVKSWLDDILASNVGEIFHFITVALCPKFTKFLHLLTLCGPSVFVSNHRILSRVFQ